MTNLMTFTKPAALGKINRILKLIESPMTAHALALAVPISKRWANEYLRHLHAEGRAHITTWVRDIEECERMYPRPVWLVGAGIDAPRLPALTLEERKKRAWQRIKENEDKHDRLKARRRLIKVLKRPRPDPAAAWIGAAA